MSTVRLSQFFVFVLLTLAFFGNSFAQEWTTGQKEVFETIEKAYEFWANRDLDGYMSNFHKDFTGWYQNGKLPLDKHSLEQHENVHLNTEIIRLYEVKPVTIKIIGNTAVVHFYSTSIRENENAQTSRWSKWTYTLIKEGEKWLIIGAHGGKLPD